MPIPPPPPYNRVYCPINPDGVDEALATAYKNATKDLPGVFGVLVTRDNGQLKDLAQTATLYLLVHGVSGQALFSVGDNYYTVKKLVNDLVGAGLKKDHRQIVMLVCNAGSSIGSKADISGFSEKRKEYKILKKGVVANSDELEGAKRIQQRTLREEIKKFAENYEDETKLAVSDFASDHILPMAAQLVQQLKNKKYTHIRVRAFRGEVSNVFSAGIKITTYIRSEGGKAIPVERSASSENTVEWL